MRLTPTMINPAPRDGVDDLGEAVLSGLGRPIGKKQAWSVLRTAVLGLLTFGVAPAVAWQRRFREFATLEQQQLWHLADWMRRAGRPAGARLREEAEAVRFHAPLKWLVLLCVGFIGWTFYKEMHPYHVTFHDLMLCTYQFPQAARHHGLPAAVEQLFAVWTLGLSVAYAVHWIQVQFYAASVRRFLRRFNEAAVTEGYQPVAVTSGASGLRPLWLVVGFAFACAGALWGLPMMLAGAAQRQLIRRVSTRNRGQLAHRLRGMMLAARPGADVPVPVYLRPTCGNALCRNQLSERARFCPRCGRPVAVA